MSSSRDTDRLFVDLVLDADTLSVYVPRRALLDAVKSSLHQFEGTLLDVGCGQMPYRDLIRRSNPRVTRYVGLDLPSSRYHDTTVADLTWDGTTIPLPDGAVQTVLATEFLEHSFRPGQILAEMRRVLAPGGVLFFTVPFVWPLHECPHDAYRYTPYSLRGLLEEAGFSSIAIHSLGGWHASMAQMLGLWAKDGGLVGFRARLARWVALAAIPRLLGMDVRDDAFGQHCMTSGLYGTAVRKG